VEFDLANEGDDAELRGLLRDTPMGGSIELAFLAEPSFFRASRIQGTEVQVLVARRGGRILGAATRALRPAWINGVSEESGYLGDLRVRREARGGTILARGFRQLRELHADGRAKIYSTVIVEDNRTALATLAANRRGLPIYTDLGRIVTPMLGLVKRLPDIAAYIVRGTPHMLPEIVAKLNEPRMQFAPVWTAEDFRSGRLAGFRVEDFYVLRRGGKIVGVLGVWDQRSFRQTLVSRYRGALGLFRPVINLFRRPPLPAPGSTLAFATVAFVATDGVEEYRALLRRAYNEACDAGLSWLCAGVHESDPRLPVLSEYPATPFSGRLFAVTYDAAPRLDGRIPWVEAALL
jgi:hypothetical protein